MASKKTVRVGMKRGIHARPALMLTRLCETFASGVRLRRGKTVADGKRILDVLMLGAAFETEIEITADGADEAEAIQAVALFLETEEEDV